MARNPHSIELYKVDKVILINKVEIENFNNLIINLEDDPFLRFWQVTVSLHPSTYNNKNVMFHEHSALTKHADLINGMSILTLYSFVMKLN